MNLLTERYAEQISGIVSCYFVDKLRAANNLLGSASPPSKRVFFAGERTVGAKRVGFVFALFDSEKRAESLLQQQWVLEVGEPTKAFKDGSKTDYIAVELSRINFQGKTLDNRCVTLVS